mmetsp:Transcript_34203/g.82674  ORF Transcript_34203/g.82674 Transcript_34203/m.82674 type:complete len:207 (+) Transcript_34203:105-725(+)
MYRTLPLSSQPTVASTKIRFRPRTSMSCHTGHRYKAPETKASSRHRTTRLFLCRNRVWCRLHGLRWRWLLWLLLLLLNGSSRRSDRLGLFKHRRSGRWQAFHQACTSPLFVLSSDLLFLPLLSKFNSLFKGLGVGEKDLKTLTAGSAKTKLLRRRLSCSCAGLSRRPTRWASLPAQKAVQTTVVFQRLQITCVPNVDTIHEHRRQE